jgi:hypothetical protein
MKWILLWTILGYGAGSAEFDSEAACKQAADGIKVAASTSVVTVCARKDS